jgi:hypothetical protein
VESLQKIMGYLRDSFLPEDQLRALEKAKEEKEASGGN